MVSLGLVIYSLVYKPYIGFIVKQVLNIICNRQGFYHCGRRLNHVKLCVCSLFHASFHIKKVMFSRYLTSLAI